MEGIAPIEANVETMSPAEELATLVGWATALFYAAEVDHNPGVKTIWDAYHYVTTSLSVGYANIFPVTPAGKVIGGIVMTIGPALSGEALNATRASASTTANDGASAKLDEVIAELKKLNAVISAAAGAAAG